MASNELDPFGLWPRYASALASLREGEPHKKRGYAFHTPYASAGFGEATWRVRLDGISGRGTLRIRLQSLRDGRRPRLVREERVTLAPSARPVSVDLSTKVDARRTYAIRGVLTDVSGAAASAVRVIFDGSNGAEDYRRRLLAARAPVFGPSSTLRGAARRRRGKVERLGLVQAGKATLSAPVSQMCTTSQLDDPEFKAWMAALGIALTRHRKVWEFAYILAVLERHGMLAPGRRGLGFGTGVEPLPALMARRGCEITATDLAGDDGAAAGWVETDQHAAGLESLWKPEIVDRSTFERAVSFRPMDMNAVSEELSGFDYCWSACAFEHLGSIAAGLDFVERSIATLRPDGIAVHTTELNLSSDDDTVDKQGTVLFRRRDFETLALRLHDGGHRVLPLCWDQGNHPLDEHVDVPPYRNAVHLKIALAGYVTTSFGIAVVRDGARAREGSRHRRKSSTTSL